MNDLADVVQNALTDHTHAINDFIAKQQTKEHSLSARVLELEQKGVRPLGGGGGDDNQDLIMPAFEGSDGFKSLLKGETTRTRVQILAKALHRKTAITSTITGGTVAAADRASEIVAPSKRRSMLLELLPSVPTNAGATEFVRELTYANRAGPQGGGSSPTETEGQVKPASDLTFEVVNSPVVTIAHTFTVSRQALEDSAALAQHLQTRGIYGWQLEVEDELLTGDGTAGTLSGLVANATPFASGATNQTPLDTVRKAITQLALTDHVASGVVLNPRDAETLELQKDTTGAYLRMVLYVNGQAVVWRIPIIESNSMTAGTFLAGDFTMAARIRDRTDAHVEISLDHSDYRTRNLALILIEGRLGLEIHRPSALVTGSLSHVG